jgi:hypothetical protein
MSHPGKLRFRQSDDGPLRTGPRQTAEKLLAVAREFIELIQSTNAITSHLYKGAQCAVIGGVGVIKHTKHRTTVVSMANSG